MHYWSRFDNHARSIKFAQQTRLAAEQRMEALQTLKGTGLLDVQFIVDSVNAVIQNKRILQYLYVFAYYFHSPEGSSDRALFEMQQAQLEKFTDELHGQSENSKGELWRTHEQELTSLRSFSSSSTTGMAEQPLEELLKPEVRVRMLSFVSTVSKFRKGLIEAVELSNQKHRAEAEDQGPNAQLAAATASAAAAEKKAVLSKSKSMKK
jgi:hypothetical protein